MKEKLKILVIGSGGREYEIVRKLGQSSLADKIFCAPENVGMQRLPKVELVNIKADDIPVLLGFALKEKIGLTIVGPEDPLVKGIVDTFEMARLKIFGPSREAAVLEGSKAAAKSFMTRHCIPTAPYRIFQTTFSVREYIRVFAPRCFPLVLKVDGLAAGKGVKVCKDARSTLDFLKKIDDGQFKGADGSIILEDFLEGEEASFIVMVDKNGHILPLASSQDHKPVGDGDTGDMTGGTGAYSPAPVVTEAVEKRALMIARKVVDGMREEGKPYVGFLYLGLMIKGEEPKVLEFNVRLGDPETQPILARMKSDLVGLIVAALDGRLERCQIEWDEAPAVCVVKMAEGYPGTPFKGDEIVGIEEAEKTGAIVSLAGVAFDKEGNLVTSGGRVLSVTAKGDRIGDFAGAKERAYVGLNEIFFRGEHWRTDIADRAISRQI